VRDPGASGSICRTGATTVRGIFGENNARSWGRFDSPRRGSLDEASYAVDEPLQVEGECEGNDQGRDHGSTRSGDPVLERIIRETKHDVQHDPCRKESHSKHDIDPKLRVQRRYAQHECGYLENFSTIMDWPRREDLYLHGCT